ncbi:hypothetical protein MIR68_002233 [Amoeboaphelidium protococcarum]|nr:hypothetical protein MIR68_002233 [Amoeboaphelidium protococcarum]
MSYNFDLLAHLYPLMGIWGVPGNSGGSDDFEKRLVSAYQSRNQLASSMDPSPLPQVTIRSETASFRYMFLSKNMKELPVVRKGAQQQSQVKGQPKVFSRLSPLNPQSSLYPDGIIQPEWIPKYRDQLPSVVMCYFRLTKEDISFNPLDPSTRDTELTLEINSLKKQLADYPQLKFVVVLITDQDLNDESLEERGAYIKKMCNLDYRHSYFVISTRQQDLQEFIVQVERTMLEYSALYYREHGKKTKKKKGRVSQNPAKSANSTTISLWNIRYDYKMGAFAELMRDFELATQHYIQSYNALSQLIKELVQKPAAIKQSRWREYDEILSSLSFKISSFLSFSESPLDGLFQLHRHLNFGYGLLDQYGSYYGWCGAQFMLFAGIVQSMERRGITLPIVAKHQIAANVSVNYIISQVPVSLEFASEWSQMQSRSLAPSKQECLASLQHSGHYFLMAALCLYQMRISRQRQVSTSAVSMLFKVFGEGEDIGQLIIEHLTNAYDIFRKRKQTRIGFMIAKLIAQNHMMDNRFDIAMKLLDKIVKSYHRECWSSIVLECQAMLAHCAIQLCDVSAVLAAYVDLISYRQDTVQFKNSIQQCFQFLSSQQQRVLALQSEYLLQPLNIKAGFQHHIGYVGTFIPVQLIIPSSGYQISQMEIQFNATNCNVKFKHDSTVNAQVYSDTKHKFSLQRVKISDNDRVARCNLQASDKLNVIQFLIKIDTPLQLSVVAVKCVIGSVNHPHQVEVIQSTNNGTAAVTRNLYDRQWYGVIKSSGQVRKRIYTTEFDPQSIKINLNQPRLKFDVVLQAPVFVSELYAVELRLVNGEKTDFMTRISARINNEGSSRPFADDQIYLSSDQGSGSSMIEDQELGIIQKGKSMLKKIFIRLSDKAGPRVLHLKVSSKIISSAKGGSESFSSMEESILLNAQSPFTIVSKLASTIVASNDKNLPQIASPKSYDLRMLLKNRSIVPLVIDSAHISNGRGGNPIQVFGYNAGCSISPQQSITLISTLENMRYSQLQQLQLLINWRRENSTSVTWNQSLVDLSLSSKLQSQLEVVLCKQKLNSVLYQPMVLKYLIHNHSDKLRSLAVSIDLNENFALAGYKSSMLQIMPRSVVPLQYEIVPLSMGWCKTPRLNVKYAEFQQPQQLQDKDTEAKSISMSEIDVPMLKVFVAPQVQ